MNEYTHDYGKVGLTFETYAEGHAVEELTMVAYNGELYVSLVGTVMTSTMPESDWYRVTNFGELLTAIRKVKADADELLADITAIHAAAAAALEGMAGEINAKLNEIEGRADEIITRLNVTNTTVAEAERLRAEAEALRVTAEGARREAEQLRAIAETARDTEEQNRKAAEAKRVTADNARKEEWAHLKTDINTTIETADAAAARAIAAVQGIDAAVARANTAAINAEQAAQTANTEAGKIAPAVAKMQQDVQHAIDEIPADAPKDGKIYGRKNGAWVEAADEGLEQKVSDLTQDTTYLLHLFGQYATPAPQSLVIDPTRKDVAISAESMSEVSAEGWAISQPIVIRKGNIYRIKVGEASGQYVTTAMRYQYRDEQGNLRYAYKRKTQLDEHSELPVDGYLIMYGLPRDYELVVCFKYTAQYDPVVEVLTAGLLRTLAFQLGDMQDMIDQKLDVNGHSSAASVGGAMALLQKGDVPEDTYSELLTARMIGNAPDLMHVHGSTDTRTGIDDGKDVNVVVEKVWGDVVGGNQCFNTGSKNCTIATWKGGGLVTFNGIQNTQGDYYNIASHGADCIDGIKDHKYIILARKISGEGLVTFGTRGGGLKEGNFSSSTFLHVIGTAVINAYLTVFTVPAGSYVDCNYSVNYLDLTLLFPTDPDFVTSIRESDAIKVAHRLGFAAFTLD